MTGELVKDNIVLQVSISLSMAIIGMAIVYVGLAFLNKRLLPEYLDLVYRHTGDLSRMMIFLFASAWPANYLFAKTFMMSSASIAGPAIIVATVLVIVANAVILDGARITFPLIAATIFATFSCGLVSWFLTVQK